MDQQASAKDLLPIHTAGSMSRPRPKSFRKRSLIELLYGSISDAEINDQNSGKRRYLSTTPIQTQPRDDNQPWLQRRKKNNENSIIYKIPRGPSRDP